MYLSKRELEFLGEPLGDMTRPVFGGGYLCYGGGKGDSPDAPDYTPLAQASEKSAQIGAELGREQLAENKRQYEKNMEVATPIIEAQTGLMKQSIEQGDDYYNYMKANQRPVEAALNAEAMAAGTEAKQSEAASQAEADSMRGLTKSANVIARQGVRYGMSPGALAKVGDSMSATQASNIVAATGAAREKEKATGYAKKMDVAGLYRNLTGASQGSYGMALNAGNSAVGNQNQTSGQYLSGMNAGTNTIMQGQGQQIQGLSGIVNSQTSIANANANSNSGSSFGSILGGLGGLAMGLGKGGLGLLSSEEFKEEKTPVDAELIVEGIQRIPVESWKYKEGVADEEHHIGPYAEDVNREFGDAAAPGGKMLDVTTMNGLTMAAVKNLADRLDRVERKSGLRRKG